MSDGNRCPSLAKLSEFPLNSSLIRRIKRRSGLILINEILYQYHRSGKKDKREVDEPIAGWENLSR